MIRCRFDRSTARRSFTLIEVMIAIALMLLLTSVMFGFLFDVLSSRSRSLDHVQQQRAATTLIERLEADLAACMVGDPSGGAGIAGTATQIRVLTRGVAASLASVDMHETRVFGDLQSAEYRLDAVAHRMVARRGPVAAAGGSESEFTAIEGQVHTIRLRYHDGSMWRDSFDSLAARRLPVAVEVSIWHRPWPGEISPGIVSDESEPSANFDEREFALISDMDLFDPPPPDRMRIILIADSSGPPSEAGE